MLKALCGSVLIYSITSLLNVANAEDPGKPTVTLPIKPFVAEYNILHKSDSVGKGIRQLKYLEDGNFEFSYNTQINWLIFSDTREEASTVSFDGKKLIPLQYVFKREGTGSDKKEHWLYNIENNHAINASKEKKLDYYLDLPDGIQDKLSYHLQHRINLIHNLQSKEFDYSVISNSGEVRNYAYSYDGTEDVSLPYGVVKTVKFKRVKNKRTTIIWFAPELNYLLVKLYQKKGSFEQFEAQLMSVKESD
ncbi:MAG: hypothetical protein ACI9LM_003800 [Alteromonadaceae bacterium]|jgi:hypothetical protein